MTLWQSRDDVVRSRMRNTIGALLLALLALFWLAGLGAPEQGENFLLGLIMLEVFTLAPLAALAVRARRMTKLLRTIDAAEAEDLEAQSEALRDVDEERHRLERMVAVLPPGPAADVAAKALATVDAARDSRRRLVHQRAQLQALHDVTHTGAARQSVERSLAACEENLENLELQAETLCAAVAGLVDEAHQGVVDQSIDRVAETAERVRLVAESLQDLNAGADVDVRRG